MSTPLPGQIRCPTCHRSTAPGAFCTQCGTAIPDSARARPRGLDREELEDRIRTHRPGDAAFRRGSPAGGGHEQGPSAYRPYQPEPEDELILPGGGPDEPGPAHVDNIPPDPDEARPAPPPVIAPPPITAPPPVIALPPVIAPQPAPVVAEEPLPPEPRPVPWRPAPPPPLPPPPPPAPIEASEPPPRWSGQEESYAAARAEVDEPDDRYRDPEDEWDRRGSGMSPLAIGGFVLLGVLAIGVGAFISGVFSGGVALASPTPTLLVSAAPSATPATSLEPTASPSVPASLNPTATPSPLPDGFTARTEPCAEQPVKSPDGCNSSGATVSGGEVWAWIGWRKGNPVDVLGVSIVDASGDTVGTGSLPLSKLCTDVCNGWGRFRFRGLSPGNYTIRMDRNGLPVAEASFTVTS